MLRVLDLVGIDRLIDIYPDVDAALASLPDQAQKRQLTPIEASTVTPSGPASTQA